MRRPVVPTLALLVAGSVLSATAPAAPSRTPAGAVVFRPECFGALMEEEANAGWGAVGGVAGGVPGGVVGGTLGSAAGAVAQAPATTRSTSAQPAKPSKASPSNKKAKGNAPSAPSAADSSFEAGPMPSPPPPPSADTTTGQVLDKEFLQNIPAAGRAFESVVEDMSDDRDEAKSERPAEPARRDQGPTLDWGATVYLSNDDSMSLASAQRLLYAAMNHLPFDVSQIRPHELLNYFSFDTVKPDADQLFDVLASAEQDGDKLSVALAVKGASPLRQPLDLTLVVDRSCSMEDEGRMDYTKRGLSQMSDQLTPGDRLDVVLFDDRVCVPLENYVVGRDDPSLLARTLEGMRPEGSTDVGLGLRTAYDVQKRHSETHGRNRRVMIVTDALMNTGDVDPNTVSEIGRAYESDGIRLTGVGVGREFDDKVLDMLTEKGKGAYVFLGSEAVVDRVFGPSGFDQLVQTIAHDVQFALKLPPSLAMERFYGEESSTVKEDVQPIHYASGTSQLFLQDLVLKGGRPVKTDAVELEITYRDARTGEPEVRKFRTTVGAMLSADPHNVRKGLALMAWSDVLTEEAMGGDPCGAPLQRYASRAGRLAGDAEIAFVNGLVQDRCGTFELPAVVTAAGGVPFKVRVDADIPISTVAMSCPTGRSTEALSGSDVVAMFTLAPGVCDLTLSGTVDMTARVEIPHTGGDLRCVVRGGRLSCS